MTIAEKALQLKQDFDQVYYTAKVEGYSEGQKKGFTDGKEVAEEEFLYKSKYIPKTATGKVISLTDVSEVAHKVKVYGDNQEVEVLGKNLFDANTNNWGTYYASNNYRYGFEIPSGFTMINLSATRKSGYEVKTANMTLYRVDGDEIYTQLKGASFTEGGNITFRLDATKKHVLICLSTTTPSILATLIDTFDWQLEVGSLATSYEPYTHQTITAIPDGTEINSMCPNMTFIADSDITVDYYSSFGMAEKELAMWNAFTNYGTRENYTYGWAYSDYSGYTIPDGLCKSKVSMAQLFYAYQGVELPKGVDCSVFDTSTTTQMYHCYNTFAYAVNLKRIYDMGIPAVKYYSATYRSCSNLESIEIIRVNESSVFDNNCFNGCSKLTHVIFSGVIANDLNTQWCPLDDDSLISIVEALRNLYEDVDWDTGEIPDRTLILHPDCWVRLKSMIYPDKGAIEAGLTYTYYDLILRKGWKTA